MKMHSKITAAALALMVGVLALTACAPKAAAAPTSQAQPNSISVTGVGSAYGKPDVAVMQIGVESRSADPAEAVSDTTDKMTAIMGALKELGIPEEDIQTSNFSVYAQQDYDPSTGAPLGTFTYVVNNTVTVTVRDLSKVGASLGNAVKAGANNIYGVSFSVSDTSALEKEARVKAMADAKARAEQLAEAAGVALGEPMTISEYMSNSPQPLVMMEAAKASGIGNVPVSTGQIQVSMNVSVTYKIK
jgi:uncharacterized protein